jgi:hypothetical protein
MLVRAIADNNCGNLIKVIQKMGKVEVVGLTFDHGMNVLNLAID